MFDAVGFPGEGENVHYGEDGHFDAEEGAWDADFDVGVCECSCRLEGSFGGGEE